MTTHDQPGPAPATDGCPEWVYLVIGGMTCASCAARIERTLNKIDGVQATVNFAMESAKVAFISPVTVEQLVCSVQDAGYTAALPVVTRSDNSAEGAASESVADPVDALRHRQFGQAPTTSVRRGISRLRLAGCWTRSDASPRRGGR